MNLYWENGTWRKAIYDENMQPIAAWRGEFATDCAGVYLDWSPKHACMVLMRSMGQGFATPAVHALLDPNDGKLLSYAGSEAIVGLNCSDDLLVASLHMTSTGYLRDLASDVEHVLNPPSGITFNIEIHKDVALVTRWSTTGTRDILDAWLWERAHLLHDLLGPPTQKQSPLTVCISRPPSPRPDKIVLRRA